MSNYRISGKAIDDLEKIWQYTLNNWSAEQADRYYNLMIDEIIYISQNFESGKNINSIKAGYRFSKVKSHLIFYRKIDSNESVEIIRILHQNMAIKNRLRE